MESIQPITLAIISKKVKIGPNNMLLIPMFAVEGTYSKKSKSFVTTDGKRYLNARSIKGVATNDEFVCDYFANLDSEVSLTYFEGETTEEKIKSFFKKNKGNIANIMFDDDGYVTDEELMFIKFYEGEPVEIEPETVHTVHNRRKKQSVRQELESILHRVSSLNNKFQENVLKGNYTIEDVKKIIAGASDVVEETSALQDNAILFRDAYQIGEEGMLLKGDTEEARKKRQLEYASAAENTTPDIMKDIPNYFDPKQVFDTVRKTLIAQDDAARAVIREIHRKTVDPTQRNLGILITGHTGCGKTKLMQLLSKALNVPVIIIDTTQITVPGYTGADVEEILYAAYKKYGIAVENAIVYFDEIDKKGSRRHSDVGGRGVQDVLLAFLDGTTYQTRDSSSRPTDIVPINTSKMIKVAGGAFSDIDSIRKKSIGFGTDNEKSTSTTPQSSDFVKEAEMSEELMGRFPSRVRFRTLNIENMEEILRKSNESILGKQVSIFKKFGVKLVPTDGYIHRIAEQAIDSGMGAGARGLSGKVLETTGPAYEEISWNRGDISEIVLTRETADDPNNFQKVYRITEKGRH